MQKPDLTLEYDYARLIEEEKTHYLDIEITEDLKEGGVHAGDCWRYYWERVWDRLSAGPVGSLPDYLRQHFAAQTQPLEILSLGSGYCGHELDLARALKGFARVTCTDLNEALFAQAKAVAEAEGLSMEFHQTDLNFIAIEPGRYQMIFAHAVLHHVINLEYLFAEIARGLTPDGFLHLVEVVGENRRLIWQENEDFANRLLDTLPDDVTGGIRLAVLPEDSGMEGVRQADILPELGKIFETEYELTHGAFMRFICTHAELAGRFDPSDARKRRYLDFLIDCDDVAVRREVLRPLEIWGLYRPRV